MIIIGFSNFYKCMPIRMEDKFPALNALVNITFKRVIFANVLSYVNNKSNILLIISLTTRNTLLFNLIWIDLMRIPIFVRLYQ